MHTSLVIQDRYVVVPQTKQDYYTNHTRCTKTCSREVSSREFWIYYVPAQHAVQGLWNGRVSVRPSVCPVDRQQQRRAVVCC